VAESSKPFRLLVLGTVKGVTGKSGYTCAVQKKASMAVAGRLMSATHGSGRVEKWKSRREEKPKSHWQTARVGHPIFRQKPRKKYGSEGGRLQNKSDW
jgi:hypothetical protein